MKRILVLFCVLAFLVPLLCISARAAEPITIWKTAQAPKIDCVLEDSYQLIADSQKNPSLFDIKNKQKQNVQHHVQIYACWDKDYLYLYVKASCNDPHIAYRDDAAMHWIFNAHYVMTAILPDDPTKEIYKGTNDDQGGWDWSTLYNKNYLYEWTTIYDSKKNERDRADHFGALGNKTGYDYQAKSEKGYDIYEERIPLKQLSTSVVPAGLKPAVGSVFGLGVSVGFVDVGTDYKEEEQVNTNFSKYFDGKNLSALTLCKLDSNLDESEESEAEETSSAASSQTSSVTSSAASSAVSNAGETSSKTESSKSAASVSETEDIGDESSDFDYWWLIISGTAVVIAVVVIVLIVRKRRQA